MKPCISQATTLKNPFEADPAVYRGGGWTAVELWLTKLETFLAESFAGRGPARSWSRRAHDRPRRRRREACSCREARSARRTGTISGGGWHCCRAGSADADRHP